MYSKTGIERHSTSVIEKCCKSSVLLKAVFSDFATSDYTVF